MNRQDRINEAQLQVNSEEHYKLLKEPIAAILVSMDVSSLYTNIPQQQGTDVIGEAYQKFHYYNPPIPTRLLRKMLGLILKENSFQFNRENYLQTHGTAMGTKMVVSLANIFMGEIETKLIVQSNTNPRE